MRLHFTQHLDNFIEQSAIVNRSYYLQTNLEATYYER